MPFEELNDTIIHRIISFLPQQAKINLALTNFAYYNPCIQQLYKKLIIQLHPGLHQCSNFTVLSGFSYSNLGKLYTEHSQLKLVDARLTILNESIEVNPLLVDSMCEIFIFLDTFDDELVVNLQRLIDNIVNFKKSSTLHKFFVSNAQLRGKLNVNNLIVHSKVIDLYHQITPELHELIIGSEFEFGKIPSDTFSKITSLILPNDQTVYWKFMDTVIESKYKLNLTTFKFVFNNSNKEKNLALIRAINWTQLRNLQLNFGHNDANQELIGDLLNSLPVIKLCNLRKIAIVQSELYDLHVNNEQFDYVVFEFLSSLVENSYHLSYVSITHNLPEYGDFKDGFEGNYLRRKQMYSTLLPKILSKIKSEYIKVYLPNLFQSLASYEQAMNTLMWNGCKCDHCDEYLQYLDDYMMHHRYYNQNCQGYKDLNASNLLFTIGNAIGKRYINHELITDLQFDTIPRQDNLYDFHHTSSLIPIKCYEMSVVDQGEYDEPEPIQSIEIHNESKIRCKFNEKLFYHNYNRVISHYLDNMMSDIVHLNRGNAEEEEIGIMMNDGGEEDYELTVKKISINSIEYYIDKEVNGTHYFKTNDH